MKAMPLPARLVIHTHGTQGYPQTKCSVNLVLPEQMKQSGIQSTVSTRLVQ